MKKLYHYPICPLSRQARIYLRELEIPFTTIKEDYWLKRKDPIMLNPTEILPVLEEPSGLVVAGIYVITEYLRDKYPKFNYLEEDSDINCEIRTWFHWFNDRFYHEVSKVFVDEKVIKLISGTGSPNSENLKLAKIKLTHYLNAIAKMFEFSSFIASDKLSCADIAAASHLSVLDYFSEINWDNWQNIKHWYSILKSRPSFRPILQDQIAGFIPPLHYADLDF